MSVKAYFLTYCGLKTSYPVYPTTSFTNKLDEQAGTELFGLTFLNEPDGIILFNCFVKILDKDAHYIPSSRFATSDLNFNMQCPVGLKVHIRVNFLFL